MVILQLNASFSDDSREHIPDQLASLRDENHRHLGIAGGGKWWSRCLGAVAREVRRRCFLDRLVCSIELFPYRSQSFAHGSIRLPSQAYTFGLVHRAIARRAVLVITRSEGLWYAAIPELRDAKAAGRLFVLSNPRSTSLSAQTLGETGFNKVLGALCP